jgi:hypothetical protein
MKNKLSLVGCFLLGVICTLTLGQLLAARQASADPASRKTPVEEKGRYDASMKTALGGFGGFFLEVTDRKENLYSVYLMSFAESQEPEKNEDGTYEVDMPLAFQADLTKSGGKKLKIKMTSDTEQKKK